MIPKWKELSKRKWKRAGTGYEPSRAGKGRAGMAGEIQEVDGRLEETLTSFQGRRNGATLLSWGGRKY